jgi:penicillin-insensitive murein endopeptidase
MRRGSALCVLAVCTLVSSVCGLPPRAQAGRDVAEVPCLPAKVKKSRSLGLPWRGKLERGVKLTTSARIRYVTEYASAQHYYGAWQLVQLLQRAAHRVDVRLPGARLSVGEMSRRDGGDLPGHASHESGRDVDLGFYMRDAAGRPYDAFAYARFDDRGRGLPPNEGMSLDLARNWELLARLVTDAEARVQFVFVSPGIRQLLLDEGRRRGASAVVLGRAARVMVRPSEKHPHGNHFHVRIYCAPADRPRCEDRAPYWPWYPGQPPSLAASATRSSIGESFLALR